jgi:hypothetical protein
MLPESMVTGKAVDARQIAAWMKQVAFVPGVGKKKK